LHHWSPSSRCGFFEFVIAVLLIASKHSQACLNTWCSFALSSCFLIAFKSKWWREMVEDVLLWFYRYCIGLCTAFAQPLELSAMLHLHKVIAWPWVSPLPCFLLASLAYFEHFRSSHWMKRQVTNLSRSNPFIGLNVSPQRTLNFQAPFPHTTYD
jgi:hypothetical protein